MLDNLKLNATGQAEIIDVYAWMDGGSVTVILATLDASIMEIEFVQKMDLSVSGLNPHPGRLLLNKKVVDIRSDLEKKIIATLKSAVFSTRNPDAGQGFQRCLNEAIAFVESYQYIIIANRTQ